MRPQLLPLPLLHEDDSFIIDLTSVGTKCLRILRIVRYPHNQNTSGTEELFRDLDMETKHAIIRQINRRHPDKTVLPQ